MKDIMDFGKKAQMQQTMLLHEGYIVPTIMYIPQGINKSLSFIELP